MPVFRGPGLYPLAPTAGGHADLARKRDALEKKIRRAIPGGLRRYPATDGAFPRQPNENLLDARPKRMGSEKGPVLDYLSRIDGGSARS